jgi:LCP family protein required for cell wall assembly
VANESGLRALGATSGGPGGGRVANESGLRSLGAAVDRSGGRGRSKGGTRRSGKPKWTLQRKILTGAIGVVALALVLALAGLGYWQYRFDQLPKVHVAAETQAVSGQPFNMLVIGSDSRVGTSGFGSADVVTGQRSDVIQIWHVDPKSKQITVLHIPRDTLVSMVGPDVQQFGTYNRINAAFNDGVNQLVETIKANFGIQINHTVEVDFSGFQDAVNAVGGVWMDFPQPAKDAWSGLNITQAGCQLLQGPQALAVARSREYYYLDSSGYWEPDGTGDFGRIARQNAFLQALIRAAKGTYNPIKLNNFIGSLHEGIVIDDSWSSTGLLGLAADFRSFDPSALQSLTLPTTNVGYVSPWGDILFAAQPQTQQMLVNLFGSSLVTPTSPPPGTDLQPNPPPPVNQTPTTTPASTSATTAPAAAAAPTTTTPAAPSFDPTACSPH